MSHHHPHEIVSAPKARDVHGTVPRLRVSELRWQAWEGDSEVSARLFCQRRVARNMLGGASSIAWL